jgi:hypothetical protein
VFTKVRSLTAEVDDGASVGAFAIDERQDHRALAGLDPRRLTQLLRNAAVIAAVIVALVVLWPQSLYGRSTCVVVTGHSMDGTYADGDFLLVRSGGTYRVGDIVVYRVPVGDVMAGTQIVHRIIAAPRMIHCLEEPSRILHAGLEHRVSRRLRPAVRINYPVVRSV